MGRDRRLREKVGKAIGRKLTADEIVHHKDGNPENNNPKNLEVLTRHESNIYHFKGKNALDKFRRKQKGCG